MATVRKLGSLIFDEVSLVDRPANQHGLVVFAKRDTEESGAMGFYTADGQPIDPRDVMVGQTIFDESGNPYEGTDEEPGEGGFYIVDDDELDEHDVDEDEQELVGVGKRAGKPLSEIFLEDLSKALTQDGRDEVVAKALGRMEEVEKRNQDLARTVSALVDANARRDFTEIAKNYDLPFDPEDMGGLLQRLSKSLSPGDMAAVEQIMTAGSEYAKQASLLEIGYAGGAHSSVYDEVAAAAAGVVA
jgi:hypothetical protein